MPVVADCHGNAYKRRSGTVALSTEKLRSHRCRACGHLNYFTRLQVSRMKTNPHCLQCGGPTEETKSSTRRRLGGKPAQAELSNSITCFFCHRPFRSKIARKLHYEEAHHFTEEEADGELD